MRKPVMRAGALVLFVLPLISLLVYAVLFLFDPFFPLPKGAIYRDYDGMGRLVRVGVISFLEPWPMQWRRYM